MVERRNLRLACRSLFGDAAAEQGSDGAGGQRAPGKGRKERGRFIAGRHGFVRRPGRSRRRDDPRSEEHTSELQSLMRISYAVFCLKKKKTKKTYKPKHQVKLENTNHTIN